jgi:hypothetical protein
MNNVAKYDAIGKKKLLSYMDDWNLFVHEVLGVNLDDEQKAIVKSCQFNKMTTVMSGTARGKDVCAACVAICFLYLTPRFKNGRLSKGTKVICTAPTDRQIRNIMVPEFTKLILNARRNGVHLPGRLTGYDIRTDEKEWFLTGFRADPNNHEAWSGLHSPNIMFIVTEASGIPESVFTAIEGNLQGNSRILLVANPNISTGYAAASQKSPRWHKFRLDSLNAPNVLQRQVVIPGQVDYEWVNDKVTAWCQRINPEEFSETEGDFVWNGITYRPNDTFRIKVRGMFPKTSEDVLVPLLWIQLAQERWKFHHERNRKIEAPLRLGADIAGMGRDNSAFCYRFGNYVDRFDRINSAGVANHNQIKGRIKNDLEKHTDSFRGIHAQGFIDTIGEGAAIYSFLIEDRMKVFSCKFSNAAKDEAGKPLKDMTGQYTFLNMRAYLYWAIRDWLDPKNNTGAMLPPDCDLLAEELTETTWQFQSNGAIKIEDKEEIKKRLKRSPDDADALANTFWPVLDIDPKRLHQKQKNYSSFFH